MSLLKQQPPVFVGAIIRFFRAARLEYFPSVAGLRFLIIFCPARGLSLPREPVCMFFSNILIWIVPYARKIRQSSYNSFNRIVSLFEFYRNYLIFVKGNCLIRKDNSQSAQSFREPCVLGKRMLSYVKPKRYC